MKKFIAIICSALIITLVAVGCAKSVASNENQNEESLTGTISLAGATSMEKL